MTKRIRARKGLTSEVVYDPADVERLRVKLVAARESELARVSPAIIEHDEPAPETAMSVTRPSGLEPLLRALQAVPLHRRVYLTWDEARHLTGLSERRLRALVADGRIATEPYGSGVRLRRADLETL